MRTTVTLDPDVARMVEDEMHRVRRSFKEVLNEALRRGLASPPPGSRKRFRVRPHAARLLAGVDRSRLNSLADELEDAATLGRVRRRRSS